MNGATKDRERYSTAATAIESSENQRILIEDASGQVMPKSKRTPSSTRQSHLNACCMWSELIKPIPMNVLPVNS